jgi:RimJ/RimL family protein N-acetyltransferase
VDQPEITAGRLLLRPWRRSDVGAVLRAWTDPEIRRWGRYGAVVPDRENFEGWVEWNHHQWGAGERAGFAVWSVDEDLLVGSLSLRDFGRGPGSSAGGAGSGGERAYGEQGEAGYWIVPAWRGRGAAPAALGALSAWAFTATAQGGLGLRRIILLHSVRNTASCRVAQKAGFRLEGTTRESFRYADGDWHDEHLHARLWHDDAA